MLPKLFSILAILLVGVFSLSSVQAAQACKSVNTEGWQVVDSNCQIGTGLWGKTNNIKDGVFWVQCGLLSRWPNNTFSEVIRDKLPNESVVLRQEGQHYRCLVGPLNTYEEALALRKTLRTLPGLSGAFIRHVPDANSTVRQRSSDNKSAAKREVKNKGLSRQYADISGLKSPQPKDREPRYSADGRVWWRATLSEAQSTCLQDGMTLVSESTIKRMQGNRAFGRALPSRLPFWVTEQRAYDAAMQVSMPLSAESALLVLCEP